MKLLQLLSLLVFSSAMSGCGLLFGDNGLFPSKASDYLESQPSEELEVPEDIKDASVGNDYAIPDLRYASVLPEKFKVPRVESLGDVESKGSVRIQKLTDDRWIVVNRAPTQTWPLITRFLSGNNIGLALEDADGGVIETAWLKDADRSADFRERYRFELRSGVQQNTTEVLVKQQYPSSADWKKSSDINREESMTGLLAQFLASSPQQVSHSLLAQGISTANKANLVYTPAGEPYIDLELSYQRGWASLGLALEKANFRITDKDHQQGLYFVNYEPSSERRQVKRGWFSRLAFWRSSKDDEIKGEYKISVLVPEQESAQNSLQGVEGLSIRIKSDTERVLQNNEQAYLLNRILVKLS